MNAELQVLIVGLEESYRGRPLEMQLRTAGLEFSRVEGVTTDFEGRSAAEFANQRAARLFYGKYLTGGEIGCALAHLKAWRIANSGGRKWTLIFEDDVRIRYPKRFRQDILNIIRYLDRDDVCSDPVPIIVSLYCRGALLSPRELILKTSGSSLYESTTMPFSACAYVINALGARQLAADAIPLISPTDWPARTAGRVVHTVTWPWLAAPDSSLASTIGQERFNGARAWHALQKIRVLVLSISHVSWLTDRSSFGSHRSFLLYTVLYPLIRALSPRVPYRLEDNVEHLPARSVPSEFLMRLAKRLGLHLG